MRKKVLPLRSTQNFMRRSNKYIEVHEMTMADFVTLALQGELHPRLNVQEDKSMGNMRTLAFQVPEELFQKIKDYLQRNNMTQKQFVIGLIENEIKRDLVQRAAESGQYETATVSDCESVSEKVGEQPEEQESTDFSDDFDNESEETEDLDDEMDESEDQGMSLGM